MSGLLIAVIWHTPKEKNDVKVVREHVNIPKVNFHAVSSSTQKFFVKPCRQ